MTLLVPRAAAIAALVAIAAATGCLGAPQPKFYTLSAASGADAGAPVASRPDLGLIVGPLEFPRYLDRPELVSRDGSYQLVVADAHRWGGSMTSDVLRSVADDLGRLLGTARVVAYPSDARFAANYRVLLDVHEFEGVLGAKVTLRVRWTIAAVKDGRALVVAESVFEQPTASASYEDLVAAESAALGALSREIAERIAGLPPR
jgi:hypothetical protein